MGFKLPFFKSKNAPAEVPADAPPAVPPPPPPLLEGPPENAPMAPPPSASAPEAMLPRKGDLAAALRAASVQRITGASASQSAIFKPKVSVMMQAGQAAPPVPATPPPSGSPDMGGTLIGKSPFSGGKTALPPITEGNTLIGKSPSNLAGFQTALRGPLLGAATPPKPPLLPKLPSSPALPKVQVEVPTAPSPVPAVELPSDAPPTIEISTSEILPLLPSTVFLEGARESVAFPAYVSLNTAEIYPQLSKGRVVLPLPSIMASFPAEGVNPTIAGYDTLEIKIPLHLLIPRLPESLISLPATQARQEVDEGIQTPFREKQDAEPSPISEAAPEAQTPSPAPAPAPEPAAYGKPASSEPGERVEPMAPRPALPTLEKLSLVDATKVVSKGFRPLSKPSSQSKILPKVQPATPSPASEQPAQSLPTPSETPVAEPSPPVTEAALEKAAPPPVEVQAEEAAPISPPAEGTSPLNKLLDLPEGSEPTISEIAEKMKSHFQLHGVLVITEDGLPLAGSMPQGMNAETWSAVWPKFFKKFEPGGQAAALGKPESCLLMIPSGCLNIFHATGIFLMLSHGPELLSSQFGEQNRAITREIARKFAVRDGFSTASSTPAA